MNLIATEMPKTPAGQALEDWPISVHPRLGLGPTVEDISNWYIKHAETLREALQLLDQVQRGAAKVLRREPTDDMVWVKVSAPGQIETKNPVWARTAWKAMYDAAPSFPNLESDLPKPEGSG